MSDTKNREIRPEKTPRRAALGRRFRAGGNPHPHPRRGPGAGAQYLHVGRSLYARTHGRPRKLHPAVPDRGDTVGRSSRPGDRFERQCRVQGGGLRVQFLGLAGMVRQPGWRSAEGRSRARPPLRLSRHFRHAGPDRLCGAPQGRRIEGGRTGVRLRRQRRRRRGRLPDRQEQGLLCRRLRRLGREMRLAVKEARVDKAINYKTCGTVRRRGACGVAARHRRLFRQCRRRPSGSRPRQYAPPGTHRGVRHDRAIQRDHLPPGAEATSSPSFRCA